MNYVTVEVEIDHGRVKTQGQEPLPEKASGLLTLFPTAASPVARPPLPAWDALQKQLRLDAAGASNWMTAIRNARR